MTDDQRGSSILASGSTVSSGFELSSNGGCRSGAAISARLRKKELNHRWLNWSPISSPTSTGCDSSSSGGSTSGEITSPRLVNTVRYQGVRRRSPSDMPICTGREVRRKGGNLGGAKVSARFATSDLQSGGSQPSGGKKLSSPSAGFSEAEGCSEGQAGSMLDITTLECRNRGPRSQMLSHIFTLAGHWRWLGWHSAADLARRTAGVTFGWLWPR